MKTRTNLSKGILCSLMLILCIVTLAACIRYVGCPHEWGEWIVKDPTCASAGEKSRECTLCGETETITIDPLPHTWNDATCTKPQTCSVCFTTTGEALPHSHTEEIVKNEALKSVATCTSAAVYYKSCSCGHISEDAADTFLYGEMLPHVYDQNVPKDEALKSEATADSDAVYYKSCVCGKVSTNDAETFTHVHSYVEEIVAPTCTEQGYTLHICACGDFYKDTYVDGAHTWADATCTAPVTCERCGLTDGEPLGHIGGTATCKEKAICDRCSMAYGETVAHNYSEKIADPLTTLAKDATCDSAAEYYYSCSVCGDYNDKEGAATFTEGEALEHFYAWTSNGDGTHTGICQNYGCQHTVSGDCVGGTASCTQQAICEICQEYYGEVLGHDWVDSDAAVLSVNTAPTCTTAGQKQQICRNDGCNATTVITVPALGHDYSTETIEPTCTTPGYTIYTCQNADCGHSYESDHVTNSHKWNIEAPTCTDAQICSVCGETNEATGHSHTLISRTAATCTQAATQTYKCANCEDSYTENIGTPTAHNTAGVEPTLVAVEGHTCLFTEHYTCADCDADVVGAQVEKHGKYTASIQNAATCIAEGTKLLTCADCGETKTEAIPVDTTLGHTWVEGSVADGKRIDTCHACGSTKSVTIITENQPNKAEDLKDTELSIGGANINFGNAADSIGQQTQNDVTIGAGTLSESDKHNIGLNDDLLGQIGDNPIYNFTVTDTEENLITNFGEDVYVTITLPYELGEDEDVDAIAIWFINDQGEVESIPATYNNGYVTFQTNHFSYYTVTRLTPAERCAVYGHNFKFGETVAATCTESGYTLKYCIRCRYSEKIDVINPSEHHYVSVTIIEATCAQEGLIRHTCSTCQSSYDVRVTSPDHNFYIFAEQEATCTVTGYVTNVCSVCSVKQTLYTAPKGHTLAVIEVVAPTCTAQGYTVYGCAVEGCNYSPIGDYKNPIGHKYVATWSWAEDNSQATVTLSCENVGCQYNTTPVTEIVNSTCTIFDSDVQKEGRKEFVVHFVFDGQTFSDQKSETIPVKGHDHSNCEWQYNKHNHWYKCSEWKGNSQKIPHVFDEGTVVKAATCKSEGEITYACVCGYKKTESIPKGDAHTAGDRIYRDSETHWYICVDCGEKCNEVSHAWDNGTVTQKASCTESGLMTYRCSCGAVRAEEISAIGHIYDNACDADCNVCEDIRQVAGHNYQNGVCQNCGEREIVEHEHTYDNACDAICNECGYERIASDHLYDNACDAICNECGYERIVPDHFYDNACDTNCNVCGYERIVPDHFYDNACDTNCNVCGFVRAVAGHNYQNGVCTHCGNVEAPTDCEYHSIVDGVCEICGFIPVFENASVYDNDGDGENDIFYFTPILPEKFLEENGGVHVWAGDYIPELSSSYVSHATFNEITHWYCTEGTGEFFTIKVTVAEAGIYEMAIHLRMKDSKERGTKYTVNAGTEYEYSFETSFQFATDEDAFEARENDYTMSSYMFGINVNLVAGDNYIKIEQSSMSPKCQHYRDFYFIKVEDADGCAHEYVEIERQDSTCSTSGYIIRTCTLCGKTKTTVISPKKHQLETTFDMQGTSCTDGYYITQTCTVCGFAETSTYLSYYHQSVTVAEYNLRDYGATGGYVRVKRCACGEIDSVSFSSCTHGYSHTSNQYTDEQGIRWYVETRSSNCECAIRYDRAYYYADNTENCTRTTYYEISVVVGNTLVTTYEYTTTEPNYHDYTVSVALKEGATDCTGGVTATYTCRNCAHSYTSAWSSHNTYEQERIDLAQYGSVCGGYVTITGCACGYSKNWSINSCDCEFDQEWVTDWVDGDINSSQYTAAGYNSFYTDCYTYTCAVTSPTKCGFTIRYATYWKRNNDCSASQYLTIQFGYDATNGTYVGERTFVLKNSSKTYHNYQSSSIENGTKYLCPDCGSYYTSCSYKNENNNVIKNQTIYVNTLNDGKAIYREETIEYYRDVDSRWNGQKKLDFKKTIYADNTENWTRYDYTYADYAAPFGESGYTKTQRYTTSSGSDDIREYAYTTYRGYQFDIYDHSTSGTTWRNYDYTYSFENGCVRERVYTTSSGINQTTTQDAHPTWSYTTIKAATCTQYGIRVRHCPLCEHDYDESSVSPIAHNWTLLYEDLYYCSVCGLMNTNGANGDIVMEDLTQAYGNGTSYVIGYWMRTQVAFTPYVSIYLHAPIVIGDVEEYAFTLYLTDEQFHFVTDEYVGLYVTIADIEAAVALLCQEYGIDALTSDMYDVTISFVPDGADGNFDYAITFDELPSGVDAIVKDDAFFVDYVPKGGYVEYTIIPDETAEWVFTSHANQDTYVHLYDANGKQLAYNDDGGEGNNFLLNYALEAGKTYVLRIRWYGNSREGYMPVAFDKGHVHVVEIIPATATCTESGYTEGQRCKDCGKTLVAQMWVSAIGHNVTEWTQTKASTCATAGEKQGVCTVCNQMQVVTISKIGHTVATWTETKAPTCSLNGQMSGTCTVCQNDVTQSIPATGNHQFENDYCVVCGMADHEHYFVDGVCEVCGLIPVFENASVYDNDSDGVNESYFFTPILPEKFAEENGGVHVWAGDYIPELSSSYVSSAMFSDIRHWYCTEGTGEFFTIKVTVAEAGVYEMAIHMRLKDSKERGTKYTVNEGTENEYSFETSFQFATDEDAFAARENDYTMSSYMFGIYVELQAGDNYIKIEQSTKSPKCQHYRDFYFTKVGEWTPICTEHSIFDGICEICGFIPVFETVSIYDYDGDGANDIFYFTPILPEKFTVENGGVHVWAGDYIPEQTLASSATFNEITHWYAQEMTTPAQYITYKVSVAETGIYEMAIHMRMKDDKPRGTKYTVNEGTENEYSFNTSFSFASEDDVYATRENDYTMSSYMFGIRINLQAGDNYIKIEMPAETVKPQHYRDFYFVKVD